MAQLPLSERVSAPVANLPTPLDAVVWRPLTLDDVDGLVALHRTIADADHPDWADSREEIQEELSHSYMDLTVDSLAAVSDAGELLAWGMVIFPPNQETLVRSILVGGVAPSHRGRGIGRAVLQWQQRRALQQLATSSKTLPGMIVVAADERATAATRAITRAGFIPDRFFQTLARPTQQPIANGSVVPDITIAPWSADYSRSAHAARDSAFRNHGSSQPMSEEQWDSMLNMSTAAPVHSFVAVDGAERVVGVLLTLLGAEDEKSGSSGYVWVVGVVPEMRRQGIATALLTAHLRSLAVAGIDRSVLDVATDTPDAGIELFDGLGYSRTALSVNYVQVY